MKRGQRHFSLIAVLWTLLCFANGSYATIRYVKPGGTGSGTSTWSNASGSVQAMIDASSAGTNDEVWVAQGTYKPGTLATHSYSLKNGIRVRGGFYGTSGTEGDVNARDTNPLTNNTVLSGDLGGGVHSATVVKAISTSSTSTTVLQSFTIIGGRNGQGGFGAGIHVAAPTGSSSPTIQNCRIIGNSSSFGGGMSIDSFCSPFIDLCIFESNVADYGGAVSLASSSTTLPTFDRCRFEGNIALVKGGAVLNDATGSTTYFRNCLFIANEARTETGGAISNESSARLLLRGCVFSRNVALGNGGAIDCELNNTVTITNSTFSANRSLFGADGGGGLRVAGGSTATMTNCVLWGNSDPGGTDESAQVFKSSNSTLTATYNSIEDWGTISGTGNNGNNPSFIAAGLDNLRLATGSLSINTGNNSAVPGDLTTDADGRNRIISTTVDRGAYEYDAATDCNGNSIADDAEIAFDPAKDCNSNRILDVCEIVPIGTGPDCNSNGVMDSCEIASGTSFDCQGDGIPDECQFPDCDHNCVDDTSELTGNDCDSSNVLEA